jgi:hypothetical protein
MAPEQEAGGAETLVPPRPNLGPEPWPDAPGWLGVAGWWGSGLALMLLLVLWRRRRRRSRAGSSSLASPIDLPAEVEPTPRQRLITASVDVRGALIGAFGTTWASKTTEEIADEPKLAERFDPPEVERLVAFLRLADRVKFAEAEPSTPEDWEAWAIDFVSGLGNGATPRINGK